MVKPRPWSMSNLQRNKMKKIINGNIAANKSITAIHWNMGAKYWLNKKLEIENINQQFQPDLYSISEANIHQDLTDYERSIPGYRQITPKLSPGHNFTRLILLVKESLNVKILENLMDPIVAAVWVRIGERGRKPVIFGMI